MKHFTFIKFEGSWWILKVGKHREGLKVEVIGRVLSRKEASQKIFAYKNIAKVGPEEYNKLRKECGGAHA
jgi:hypothetical protein